MSHMCKDSTETASTQWRMTASQLDNAVTSKCKNDYLKTCRLDMVFVETISFTSHRSSWQVQLTIKLTRINTNTGKTQTTKPVNIKLSWLLQHLASKSTEYIRWQQTGCWPLYVNKIAAIILTANLGKCRLIFTTLSRSDSALTASKFLIKSSSSSNLNHVTALTLEICGIFLTNSSQRPIFHDSLHLNKNHTFQRPHSDHLHLSAILKYTVQQHIMYTVPHERRIRNSIHNCHSPAFAATVHAFTYTTHNRWQIISSRFTFHKKSNIPAIGNSHNCSSLNVCWQVQWFTVDTQKAYFWRWRHSSLSIHSR